MYTFLHRHHVLYPGNFPLFQKRYISLTLLYHKFPSTQIIVFALTFQDSENICHKAETYSLLAASLAICASKLGYPHYIANTFILSGSKRQLIVELVSSLGVSPCDESHKHVFQGGRLTC